MLQDDPIHVLIETALLSTLLYLFFYRKKEDWRNKMKQRLTEDEIEELLNDWKDRGRYDLATGALSNVNMSESDSVVVDTATVTRKNGRMYNLIIEGMEGSNITLRVPSNNKKESVSTGDGIDNASVMSQLRNRVQSAKEKKKASTVLSNSISASSFIPNTKTITALNFATYDYLGMSCPATNASSEMHTNSTIENAGNNSIVPNYTDDPIKYASQKALSKYGCGSCGPRGFYGTIDAHLHLETAMADFTSTEEAILYSDGATTAASTVAAFAKRGDLLVVDEGVYEALGTGVTLSRANVKYFQHNDMTDLRRVLERVQAKDKSLGRKRNDQRRFIVVEGLYKNYGTICPLKELVELKQEFSYRLILDESFSFGALGKTGRGALEHFGLRAMVDAEILIISMENALGSIGGVTVGNEEVVDHQRLSGAGYCFSASSPPFLADAARASLQRMKSQPGIVEELTEKVRYFYQKVEEVMKDIVPKKVIITSQKDLSPIVFFQLGEDHRSLLSREEQVGLLEKISEDCLDRGLFLISTGRHLYHHLHRIPSPALRLTIMNKQSKEEINIAVGVLKKAIDANV